MSAYQFLVFAGEFYYPCGGWADFKNSFESLEQAKKFAEKIICVGEEKISNIKCEHCKSPIMARSFELSWAQVVDIISNKVLELHYPDSYCSNCKINPRTGNRYDEWPCWEEWEEKNTNESQT